LNEVFVGLLMLAFGTIIICVTGGFETLREWRRRKR